MTTTRVIQRTVSLDQGLQLAQVRPTDLIANLLYSPPEAIQTEVDEIEIANTSASVVLVQIFHDRTGSLTTPLQCVFIREIQPQDTITHQINAYLVATVETMHVQVSIADTVTFTLYGRETQERAR